MSKASIVGYAPIGIAGFTLPCWDVLPNVAVAEEVGPDVGLLRPLIALALVLGTTSCWGTGGEGQCAADQMVPGEECHDVGNVESP